jgi:hypothetical protein
MGLEALSTEEKAQLLKALQAEGEGADTCDCDSKFETVAGVLDTIVAKIDAYEERIASLEKTLMEDMIGGIRKLYADNVRTEGLEGLKSKYGDLFNPHMDAFKEFYPSEDLWSRLYDSLESMKGQDGYSDEMGDKRVREIADQLGAKVAKVRGPVAAKVEVATPEAGEVDPMSALVESVKKMKRGKSRIPGIMPGADMES